MASVEITISGVLYDKVNRTTQPVVLIGEASLTGVGIGGGPIIPPEKPKPPVGIWPDPPEGIAPIPEHPIVIPPVKPPDLPPTDPPVKWKAVWLPQEGWVVVGVISPDVPHPVPSK